MTYFGIQDQNHGMVLMAAWGGKWCCNGLKEPATYILVDFDYGVPLLGHDEVIVRVTGVKMGGQERMIAADCNDAGLDANATRQGIRNHYVNPSQVDAVSRLPMCMRCQRRWFLPMYIAIHLGSFQQVSVYCHLPPVT